MSVNRKRDRPGGQPRHRAWLRPSRTHVKPGSGGTGGWSDGVVRRGPARSAPGVRARRRRRGSWGLRRVEPDAVRRTEFGGYRLSIMSTRTLETASVLARGAARSPSGWTRSPRATLRL